MSRRLYVVVDHASLPTGTLETRMLEGFDGHPEIQYETTCATGGHVVGVERHNDAVHVATRSSNSEEEAFVWFPEQKREIAERFVRELDAIDQLTDRLLLASHVELLGVDAFVTASLDLLAVAKDGYFAGANIMRPEAALALIGLYLRLRGDYAYFHSGRSTASYGRTGFYEALAEDLLPETHRWRTCCPVKTSPSESGPRDLVEALVTRVDRALRARDRLHQPFLDSRSHQTNDEALFYFDALLFSLSGAFDAVARVAHHAYSLGGHTFEANWRTKHQRRTGVVSSFAGRFQSLARLLPLKRARESWMQRLAARAPAVARLMHPNTAGRDVLELTALLRNTIHGEALDTIGFHDVGARDTEYPVVLPPPARNGFVQAVRRRGGDANWGVRQISADLFVLDVPTFVEALFPRAMQCLNELMLAIEIERIRESTASATGRTGRRDESVERIRLLSGLPRLGRPGEPS